MPVGAIGAIAGLAGNVFGAIGGSKGQSGSLHETSTSTTENTYAKDQLFRKTVLRPFIKRFLAGSVESLIAGKANPSTVANILDSANLSRNAALQRASLQAAASGRSSDSGSMNQVKARIERESRADSNRQILGAYERDRASTISSIFGIMDRPVKTTTQSERNVETQGSGGNALMNALGAGLSTAGSIATQQSMMNKLNSQMNESQMLQGAPPATSPINMSGVGLPPPPGGFTPLPTGGLQAPPAPNPLGALSSVPWSTFRGF